MVRSATFTLVEASKEAHESKASSTQCRRARRARRREPAFVFGTAGHHEDARDAAPRGASYANPTLAPPSTARAIPET